MRPSSDTKPHTHLYRHFDSIGGVTHTHPTYATAWAQAQQAIPCFGTTHADYAYGEIPVTAVMSDEQIERDYEERSEEHTSELQSRGHLVCRLLLEKKNTNRPVQRHRQKDHQGLQ